MNLNKPIIRIIKTVIPSQDVTVTSPIGPLLGQYGANIKDFCMKFNEFTQKFDEDINLIVNIIVYKDKTVTFEVLNAVGSFTIFEEQFVYEKEKQQNVNDKQKDINEEDFFEKVSIIDNYKDVLGNNGNEILYFFDVNSNFFFFSEFILFYLSKKTFNDYFSQINFFFDFFITGRFLKKSKKKLTYSKNKTSLKLYENFSKEVEEYINPQRFKKKKSFFLQAGEDEEKKDIEDDNTTKNKDEGNTLIEKNIKYFDLEKLEFYKEQEEMKKKKKPKNISRIVKMEKYNQLDFNEKNLTNEEINISDSENDDSFFFVPKTINLSVLYKIIKFRHFFNTDVSEKTLFRITASTILSMEIKIIDDIF